MTGFNSKRAMAKERMVPFADKLHEAIMKSTKVEFKYNPWTGELDSRKETFDKEEFAMQIIRETLDAARAGMEFGDGMESAVEAYWDIKL